MRHLLFAFLLVLSAASAADVVQRWQTTPLQADIIGKFTEMLATQHVAHVKLDDKLSEKVWKRLIEEYDDEHCYFYQRDIKSFEPMRLKLDDALRAKDASFGFTVYDVYVKRVRAGACLATNLLARIEANASSESDFRKKTDGEYVFKGEGRAWPETEKDMLELWQRKIRSELLERFAEAELDAEKDGGKVVFKDIVRELTDDYVQQIMTLDAPDPDDAFDKYLSVVGMVNDPHTLYLNEAMKKMLDATMSLSFCGIGVSVDPRTSGLYVLEVIEGGPADKDGRLKPGDRIVGVGEGDGPVKSIKGMPSEKATRSISGKKGTKVTLEVVTAAGKRSTIKLVRNKIKLKNDAAKSRVESVKLNGRDYKLGYIKLPVFYGPDSLSLGLLFGTVPSAGTDVAAELAKLSEAGVQGVALDLRGNGGGLLSEALMLSALFVNGGAMAQIQNGGEIEVLATPEDGVWGIDVFRKPMVVLIDRSSASASELVSGLLKDRGRAVIVGDRQTHGKGTMQGVIPLGRRRGEALITLGLFYRITGSSTQLKGVASDILLPSVLNGIDSLGEDNMPDALPWRSVGAAKFTPDWDMPSHVAELSRRSSARQKSSAAYRAHMEKVRAVAESCNRKSMSLDYETVKAQKRLDRKSGADRIGTHGREISVAEDKEISDKDGLPRRDKDAVLDESLNILADLVDITKGKDMPKPKRKGGGSSPSLLKSLFGYTAE